MRKLMLPALVVGFAWGLASPVRADDDAKKIVENAIKAYGGAEKIEKIQATVGKMKGSVNLAGNDIDFTLEMSEQLPDKTKSVIAIEIMGNKITITQVYDGKNGYANINGVTMDIEGKQLDEMKASVYSRRVMTLVPLLKEKGFKLSALGETKVNGKAALGIKVESEGNKAISLFFDKETHLLVKSERRVFDDMTQEEVAQEEFYSEYKDIGGVKNPMKLAIHRDGKKFIEAEVTEAKRVDKLDDKEFAKP